ncbi:MAG: galactose mutarotase [Oscillospiraceae bacterium]|jgi:aldose 1-epimerase|nr:galactose mutarotase [Oscillospiraceae bacterium]
MSINKEVWGTKDGREVYLYTMANAQGASVSFTTYGGHLISINVPDKDGKLTDVLLGYDTLDRLLRGSGFMGALVGRYANRIGGAKFTLDGKQYTLAANNGANTLHGGLVGFDKQIWNAAQVGGGVRLSLVSRDGDEGFPGELAVSVLYTWSDDNALDILYEATASKKTVVNLTNHAYFNLAGLSSEDLSTHTIALDSDYITEIADGAAIPTGKDYPVEGTPFDLRNGRNIGVGLAEGLANNEQMKFVGGYDHNYVLNGEGFRKIGSVCESATSRAMDIYTDQPGVQFYSGNSIKEENVGKNGEHYKKRQGFCLETQKYPDTPNQPSFPSAALRPGETYTHHTRYAFGVK